MMKDILLLGSFFLFFKEKGFLPFNWGTWNN